MGEIGPELEIARVLGALPADQPGLRRADGEAAVVAGGVPGNVLTRRKGERVVHRDVLDDLLRVLPGERLEVGAEQAEAGHVFFSLAVEPGMNRVVGTLEQPELTVLR